MLDVDGESGGRSGRGERPAGFNFQRVGVDGDEFGFVFDVDEDGAFAVGDGEFGAAAEVDGADDGAGLGVNHSGAVGIAVHDEDALGEWVVEDGVGVLVGFGFAGDFEGLQIEDNYFALAAIGDEAFAEFDGDGNAVILLEAGDVADGFTGVGVEDDDFGAVRDVDAAGGGIDADVVEIFASAARSGAKGVFFELVVARSSGQGERNGSEQGDECAGCEACAKMSVHAIPPLRSGGNVSHRM